MQAGARGRDGGMCPETEEMEGLAVDGWRLEWRKDWRAGKEVRGTEGRRPQGKATRGAEPKGRILEKAGEKDT